MLATVVMTFAAMVAFAANSLLARLALAPGGGGGAMDAGSFTALRILSGAVLLVLLSHGVSRSRKPSGDRQPSGGWRLAGNWLSALALFAYAAAFSFAYLRIGAAMGALILFSAVQGTMLIWSTLNGARPARVELIGLGLAFAAFVYLLLPGIGKPDLLGSALMVVSGVAWGLYTVRGRVSVDPLAETAGNFARAAVFVLPVGALSIAYGHASVAGVALAVASGALASGLGYAIWYRALSGLTTVRAAIVQLSVPVLATIGGAVVLKETVTLRFIIASLVILSGIALAILARRRA